MNKKNVKEMVCTNNWDYENCMTIGKKYNVEIEKLENGTNMYKFQDDNNEPLQTMINRFE